MKKYKTWEAFKMLEENNNLEFKTKSGWVLKIKGGLFIVICPIDNCEGVAGGNIAVTDEWELVKKPVDFMEAIKAFDDYKTIYCEIDNEKLIYKGDNPRLVDQHGELVSTLEILEGKWYIMEDKE